MLDIGWQELLVIGALALIVVGPKDLPSLLRSVGQWVGKVRGMARDFQRTMNDAARETEVSAFKDLQDIKKINPLDDFKKQAANAQSFLNGSGDGVTELEDKPADAPAGKGEPAKTATASAEPAGAGAGPTPAQPVEEPDSGMVDTTSSEPAAPAPAATESETAPKAATS